ETECAVESDRAGAHGARALERRRRDQRLDHEAPTARAADGPAAHAAARRHGGRRVEAREGGHAHRASDGFRGATRTGDPADPAAGVSATPRANRAVAARATASRARVLHG